MAESRPNSTQNVSLLARHNPYNCFGIILNNHYSRFKAQGTESSGSHVVEMASNRLFQHDQEVTNKYMCRYIDNDLTNQPIYQPNNQPSRACALTNTNNIILSIYQPKEILPIDLKPVLLHFPSLFLKSIQCGFCCI